MANVVATTPVAEGVSFGAQGPPGASGTGWTIVNANHSTPGNITSVAQAVLCDSSTGTVTVNLLSPSQLALLPNTGIGYIWLVLDDGHNAAPNNITVNGNGTLVESFASPGTYGNSTVINANSAACAWMWTDTHYKLEIGASVGGVLSVTANAPIISSGGQNPTISISPATESTAGSMSASDKTKLDNLPGSPVTSVTGTAPITSTGGNTPAIGISAATDSTPGSMSAADKTKLDNLPPGVSGSAPISVSAAGVVSISPTPVSSVGVTAPLTSTGGTTPTLALSVGTGLAVVGGVLVAGSGNVAFVTNSNTPYTVQLNDDVVIFDESSGTQCTAKLPASPTLGERHTFKWWKWSNPLPGPPIVNGNGKNVVPYVQNVQTSGATAASTTIDDPGGRYTVEWDGTEWMNIS